MERPDGTHLRKLLVEPLEPWQTGVFAVASVVLVLVSALASGCTLAFFSLDKMELEVLKISGGERQRRHASNILPLIRKPNHLLVTLLLTNCTANTILPILIDRLLDPVAAIIISITVIFIFGEVIPQAIGSRYGLAMGSRLHWLVVVLRFLFYPIALPVGMLLDWLLGTDDVVTFRRRQLKAFVGLHGQEGGLGGALTAEEVDVITGALDLTHKIAFNAMTPIDKVVMLSTEDTLTGPAVDAVLDSGHSRIPVYRGNDRNDIIGLVLVKELLKTFRHKQEHDTTTTTTASAAGGALGGATADAPRIAGSDTDNHCKTVGDLLAAAVPDTGVTASSVSKAGGADSTSLVEPAASGKEAADVLPTAPGAGYLPPPSLPPPILQEAASPSGELTVASLPLRHLPRLMATTPMYDMLRLFRTGRCHMALLVQPGEAEIAELMEEAAAEAAAAHSAAGSSSSSSSSSGSSSSSSMSDSGSDSEGAHEVDEQKRGSGGGGGGGDSGAGLKRGGSKDRRRKRRRSARLTGQQHQHQAGSHNGHTHVHLHPPGHMSPPLPMPLLLLPPPPQQQQQQEGVTVVQRRNSSSSHSSNNSATPLLPASTRVARIAHQQGSSKVFHSVTASPSAGQAAVGSLPPVPSSPDQSPSSPDAPDLPLPDQVAITIHPLPTATGSTGAAAASGTAACVEGAQGDVIMPLCSPQQQGHQHQGGGSHQAGGALLPKAASMPAGRATTAAAAAGDVSSSLQAQQGQAPHGQSSPPRQLELSAARSWTLPLHRRSANLGSAPQSPPLAGSRSLSRRNSGSSSSSSSSVAHSNSLLMDALEQLEEQLEEHITIPGQPLGIITIEDVIEELLRQEIVDETDLYVDNERCVPASTAVEQMQLSLPEKLQAALGMLARDPNNQARISRGLAAAQVLRNAVIPQPRPATPTAAAARPDAAAVKAASPVAHTAAPAPETFGALKAGGVGVAAPAEGGVAVTIDASQPAAPVGAPAKLMTVDSEDSAVGAVKARGTDGGMPAAIAAEPAGAPAGAAKASMVDVLGNNSTPPLGGPKASPASTASSLPPADASLLQQAAARKPGSLAGALLIRKAPSAQVLSTVTPTNSTRNTNQVPAAALGAAPGARLASAASQAAAQLAGVQQQQPLVLPHSSFTPSPLLHQLHAIQRRQQHLAGAGGAPSRQGSPAVLYHLQPLTVIPQPPALRSTSPAAGGNDAVSAVPGGRTAPRHRRSPPLNSEAAAQASHEHHHHHRHHHDPAAEGHSAMPAHGAPDRGGRLNNAGTVMIAGGGVHAAVLGSAEGVSVSGGRQGGGMTPQHPRHRHASQHPHSRSSPNLHRLLDQQ